MSACLTDIGKQDVKTLKMVANGAATPNDDDSAQFMCPLTLREMNGVQPFVYISTCGCVFSQAGLRTVSNSKEKEKDTGKDKEKEKEASSSNSPTPPADSLDLCPQCSTKYSADDIIPLNPSLEEENRLRSIMEVKRAAEPTKKKSKKRKQAEEGGDAEPPAKKKQSGPTINPSVGATSKAVMEGLAAEEAKRKANMSEAVKSLYGDGKPARKQTFMTMGTFTRVRSSFPLIQ